MENFDYKHILILDGAIMDNPKFEFDNTKLIIEFDFRGKQSVDYIIGEATLIEEENKLFADLILWYYSVKKLFSPIKSWINLKQACDTLTPAASLFQLDKRCKIFTISVGGNPNLDPNIKNLREQTNASLS